MDKIAVAYVNSFDADRAKKIAQQWQFDYIGDRNAANHNPQLEYLLQVNEQVLELIKLDEPKTGAVKVDLVEGAVGHRRKFGGGRGQDIAKAIGLKHGFCPHVLDATAGLGRDAFVLASLGCQVSLIERNPAVHALLSDGLERGQLNVEIADIVSRMKLTHASSAEHLGNLSDIDVVYLDPMYPAKEKSAAIKKEMRLFQGLVGKDIDADSLLEPALALAKYRVVVKRPSYAPPLANKVPSTSIKMKKNRFDVYVNQGIPKQ